MHCLLGSNTRSENVTQGHSRVYWVYEGLGVYAANGGITAQQLAEKLGVRSQLVSPSLSTLAARGIIKAEGSKPYKYGNLDGTRFTEAQIRAKTKYGGQYDQAGNLRNPPLRRATYEKDHTALLELATEAQARLNVLEERIASVERLLLNVTTLAHLTKVKLVDNDSIPEVPEPEFDYCASIEYMLSQ